MSERGQTHKLQNIKKNNINICYIFKSIFLSSTTDVQNLDKYTWLNWRGACTGSTNLRFTLVWILVPEGTRANHAHAAWALRQRQCAAQGRSSVQLQWSVLSRDAVGPSHSWRSTNRAGYYKKNREVDVLSVKIEEKKATSMNEYSPIHVLEVRGREVGEDSGRVSESVIVRIAWECLLSPFSFTSSSTCEAPLKVHEYNKRLENLCRAKVFVPTWLQILILRGLNGGLEYCQAEWGLKQPIIHYQWDLCLSAAKGLGLNCINLIDKTLRVGVCVCFLIP